MSTETEKTKSASVGIVANFVSLLSPLILLVLFFVATLIGGLGVVLVGRVVSQIFGLGLFEASLISLGAAFGVVYIFVEILRPRHTLESIEPDEWEDDYDEDEEDFDEDEEFDNFPRSKTSLSTQLPRAEPTPGRNDPCWCGSGKKYKNCHGR